MVMVNKLEASNMSLTWYSKLFYPLTFLIILSYLWDFVEHYHAVPVYSPLCIFLFEFEAKTQKRKHVITNNHTIVCESPLVT